MKRREIIVWIILVIGVGFYLGYKISQKNHMKEWASSLPNQNIHLEYQLENPQKIEDYGRNVIDQTATTYTFRGIMNLGILIEDIAQRDSKLGWNNFPNVSGRNYYLEIKPAIKKRKYRINLTYPRHESADYLISALGKEIGFTTIISETTIRIYRAVKNERTLLFPISTSKGLVQGTIRQNTYSFINSDIDSLLSVFSQKGFYIENATGIKDRFDGRIIISDSIEEVKQELQTKLGVDLIPFDKTVKLFIIN